MRIDSPGFSGGMVPVGAPSRSGKEPVMEIFDFEAAAELFVGKQPARPPKGDRAESAAAGGPRFRPASGSRMTYRRFATGAEAIRFVIEEQAPANLIATALESEGERFEGAAIRTLYDSERYPLARAGAPAPATQDAAPAPARR